MREETGGHHRKPSHWATGSAQVKPHRGPFVPAFIKKPAAKAGSAAGLRKSGLRGDIQNGCANNVGCENVFLMQKAVSFPLRPAIEGLSRNSRWRYPKFCISGQAALSFYKSLTGVLGVSNVDGNHLHALSRPGLPSRRSRISRPDVAGISFLHGCLSSTAFSTLASAC